MFFVFLNVPRNFNNSSHRLNRWVKYNFIFYVLKLKKIKRGLHFVASIKRYMSETKQTKGWNYQNSMKKRGQKQYEITKLTNLVFAFLHRFLDHNSSVQNIFYHSISNK